MSKLVIAIAITTNLILGFMLWQLNNEYDNLLTWACDHGNGGHECGED
jgi:hypothetical protein